MSPTYNEMLRQADVEIPVVYFLLAGLSSWLLLAGFLISPSTFVSIYESGLLQKTGELGEEFAGAVRNVPLLYIAGFASLAGVVGLAWLWWTWHRNYVWVKRYIVLYV